MKEKASEIPAYITPSFTGNTITNTYAADAKINVFKDWVHTGAPTSMRPTTVTIHLMRNGVKYASKAVTAATDWKETFEVPQKDYVGATFTITEDPVTQYSVEYSTAQDGTLVAKNTFIMPMVTIEGTKTWKNVPTGYNTPAVIIQLKRSGAVVTTQQIDSGNGSVGTYKFPEMPKYSTTGVEYTYTVAEKEVPGYDTELDATGRNFTNTYNPTKAQYAVIGEKKVNGVGAPDESFTFVLTAKVATNPMPAGSASGKKTISEKEGSLSFGVISFDNPGVYEYEIAETAGTTEGFTYSTDKYTLTLTVTDTEGVLSVSGAIKNGAASAGAILFTNNYVIPTRDQKVTKVWIDNNDALKVRPDSVQIQLERTPAGGTIEDVGTPQAVTAAAGWTYTFPKQPVHDLSGNVYTYSAREVNTSPNYKSEASDLTVTNTIQHIEVTLTKEWVIQGNGFTKPLAGVGFELWRTPENGTAEKVSNHTVTGLSGSSTWTLDVTNLPKYSKDGKLFTYFAKEPTPPFATTAKEEGLTVTNTYGADAKIGVTKTWTHTGSPSKPTMVTINLHRNGDPLPYKTAVLNASGNWTHTFDVPQVDFLGATFTVKEETVAGYSTTISGDVQNGFIVDNTYVMPKVVVDGTKTWVGVPTGVPVPPVTVYLYRSDDPTKVIESALVNPTTRKYEFTNLNQYDDDGKPYTYTVSEGETLGYDQQQNGRDFTNTYNPEDAVVQVAADKLVTENIGAPDEEFTFTLSRVTAGAPMPTSTVGDTLTVTSKKGAVNFGGILYKIPGTYVYQIKEVAPTTPTEGFTYDNSVFEMTVTVSLNTSTGVLTATPAYKKGSVATDKVQFSNTYKVPTRNITVTLNWDDSSDALAVRPDIAVIQLERSIAGGSKVDVLQHTLLIQPGDAWTTMFPNMPVHDENGNVYTYTAREVGTSPNYDSTSDVLTITDKIKTQTLTLTKEWVINGTGFTVPANVTFELYRKVSGGTDEKVGTTYTLTGSGTDTPWTTDVSNLPKFSKAGLEFTYFVKEPTPPFATTKQETGLKVTNTYGADQKIEVLKTWNHTGAPVAQRPNTITVDLFRDSSAIPHKTIEIKASDAWKGTFSVSQQDYLGATFTVKERTVTGYTSTQSGDAVNGFVISNVFDMPMDTFGGKKDWEEVPTGLTVPTVTINLWRSDNTVAPFKTTTINSTQNTYGFSGLPRYNDDGIAYVYTVTETSVPGYISELDTNGKDFVNTYAPNGKGFTATAQKFIPGDTGYPTETFQFTLKATGTGEKHPMPSGTVSGVKTASVIGENAFDFGEMIFIRPGTYTYEVAEVIPTTPTAGFTYDTTVYELVLTVTDIGGGDLAINPVYQFKGGATVSGFAFNNTYTTPKKNIDVTKVWVDESNNLNLRPTSAKVQLKRTPAGGVIENVGTPESIIGTGNTWTYTYLNQPVHDAAGKAYTYSIVEVDVDANYTASISNMTMTNTIKDASVLGKKEATPRPASANTVPVVNAGDTIVYSITIENPSDRKLYETRVMDTLPKGVSLQAGTTPAPDATIVNGDGTTTLMWKIAVINEKVGATNGSVTINIPVQVDALAAGEKSRLMENTAYYRLAKSAGEPLPLIAGVADSTADYTPTGKVAHQLITLEKTADIPHGTIVAEGQQIEYTITLYSAAAMAGIQVQDVIPTGMTFVPGSIRSTIHPSASNSYHSAGTVTFPAAAVPAGGATFRFKAQINKLAASVMEFDGYKNEASAKATVDPSAPPVDLTTPKTDGNQVSRREIDSVAKDAKLVVGGTPTTMPENGSAASPVATRLNQIIEYTLTVTTKGYLPSGNIRVTDVLEEGMTFVAGSFSFTKSGTANVAMTQTPAAGNSNTAIWTISNVGKDEIVTITFRVKAPSTTDNKSTPAYETSRLLTNTAKADDLGLRALTNADGSRVYTSETDLVENSNSTYHRITEPAVTGRKTASPIGANGKVMVVEKGDQITYTITVTNNGDDAAKNVRVMDILPAGLTLVPGSMTNTANEVASTFTSGGKTYLYWVVGELKAKAQAPANSATLTFIAEVTGDNQDILMSNTAYIKTPDPDGPVPPVPSGPEDPDDYDTETPDDVEHQTFSFTASSSPAGGATSAAATQVEQGQKVTYTLSLKAAESIENVNATDKVPAGMTVVPGSIKMIQPDGTVVNVPDSALVGGTINWPQVNVGKGETKFVFEVVVDKLTGTTTERSFQNQAEVKLNNSGAGAANKTLTAKGKDLYHKTSTRIVTLDKNAQLVAGGVLQTANKGTQASPVKTMLGQEIEYTLTVATTGQLTRGGMTVTDVLDSGLTFVAGSFSASKSGVTMTQAPNAGNGNTAIWNIGGVAKDETVTIKFRVTVPTTTDNPATPDHETVRNLANKASLRDNGLAALESAMGGKVYTEAEVTKASNETYHQITETAVKTTKSASPAGANGNTMVVENGDEINYTIKVSNTGHETARYVRIMDILPEGLSLKAGSMSTSANVTAYDFTSGGKTYLYWVIDTLAPVTGEETLTFTGVVTAQNNQALLIKNVAYTLVPDPNDPTPPTPPTGPENPGDYDNQTTDNVEHQVVSFESTSDPAGGSTSGNATPVKEGDEITYTDTLDTNGKVPNVQVVTKVPDGMVVVPGTAQIIHPDGTVQNVPDSAIVDGTITWPVIDADKGETKFVYTVVVEKLDDLDKEFKTDSKVSFDNGTEDPARKDRLEINADPLYHKSSTGYSNVVKTAALANEDGTTEAANPGTKDAPVVALRGQEIEYILTVDRTAGVDNRSGDIVVTDTLPKGMTLVTGSIKGTVSGSNGTVVSMSEANGTVQWTLRGLSNGEVATLSFRATVPSTLDELAPMEEEYFFTNSVDMMDKGLSDLTYAKPIPGHAAGDKVYAASDYDKTSNETYHKALYPVLKAEKSSDIPSGTPETGRIYADTILTYTIKVTNGGDVDANQIVVRDAIPEGMKLVPRSQTSSVEGTKMAAIEIDGKTYVTWILSDLPSGESAVLTFQVTVDDFDGIGIRRYENTAEYREVPVGEDAQKVLEDPDDSKFFKTNTVGGHYFSKGGDITVKKIDASTREPLEGAEFTLVQLSADEPEDVFDIRVAYSDEEGIADFGDVPAGKYVVYESEAPEGYVASTIRRSANISKGSVNYTMTIANRLAESVLGEWDIEYVGLGNLNIGVSSN